MSRFEGQTVLVTGASRGIGLACAQAFAAAGARVGLVARDRAALDAAAAGIGAGAHAVVADLSDPGECARAVDEVVAALGPVDVLVSCAGVLHRDSSRTSHPRTSSRAGGCTSVPRCGCPSACCRGCASAAAGRSSSSPPSSA